MIRRYPIPSLSDVYLATPDAGTGRFPSSRIQKGLILELGDRDLSEEGLGFGLPVLKLGLQPIFPGSWNISASESDGHCLIDAVFEMNLRARMIRKGKLIDDGLFYLMRENLSRIHREHPILRDCMSISSRAVKKKLELKEIFCRDLRLAL